MRSSITVACCAADRGVRDDERRARRVATDDDVPARRLRAAPGDMSIVHDRRVRERHRRRRPTAKTVRKSNGTGCCGATGAPFAVRRARAEVDEEELPSLPDDPRVMRRDAGRREHDVVVRGTADGDLFLAERAHGSSRGLS